MKQVIQDFRSGRLSVDDVPMPVLVEGSVLVANRYSLISAGTERGTVNVAKASLIGKARERPDLVRQVMQNVARSGIRATLRKVGSRLNVVKSLGYSTAGVVLASLDTEGRFAPGDRVACAGGGYASHAEVVAVPQNLIAKIPDHVTFRDAAYTTVGAIALQGVRQADPKIGDSVCVIGLGLIGQLTCQILKANGCSVFGVDIDEIMVRHAQEHGAHLAMIRTDGRLRMAWEEFTQGHGFDAVIVTAAAKSNDPIVLATEMSRSKGRLVVVGAVRMDIPREPDFYAKELELRISCSYGPGRYDVKYEEQGKDYPYGYVRWTEQRNMQAFLQLVSRRALDLGCLSTHEFPIEEATRAYELLTGDSKATRIGVLLRYEEVKPTQVDKPQILPSRPGEPTVAFVGAGSFGRSFLIPQVGRRASLHTVVARTGTSAKATAMRHGFARYSTSLHDILECRDIDTVFIATQHDTHAAYAASALRAGKHVFVEKPLALTPEGLEEVSRAHADRPDRVLMVGFNRRFAPLTVAAKQALAGQQGPFVVNTRVNAGKIAREHWIQTEKGGGRIIGEFCHFVDLVQYLTDSVPIRLQADCIRGSNDSVPNQDNIVVMARYSDGSVASFVYVAIGDESLAKERVEVFRGGRSFVIDDFRSGTLHAGGRVRRFKLPGKGHEQEVDAFLRSIKAGERSPIEYRSIAVTTRACFAVLDSIRTGLPQEVLLD